MQTLPRGQCGFIRLKSLIVLAAVMAGAYYAPLLYKERIAFNNAVDSNSKILSISSQHDLGRYSRADDRTLHFRNGSIILKEDHQFSADDRLTLKNIEDESMFPWPESRGGLNLCSESRCQSVLRASMSTT